ncbi:sigma-E processing peptidase SpoIIGA [Sinanaerobacter chloroacetimidivorans]|uniref:Sigma-E processing peptidase SpoIIGA n=1 Tax=Sinanaerobacter chloroacetimidivorans TaxID=2818044 RepID=A0A8J7W5J5_9FIRM|nr:sigma-E processing peptidase SpoIIGA [Sinanaerobacter chloroacetimidivorans]MBR0599461.1 sigma-E processing peptidase SpoIIGA [Sinanaerobacter chloroacetimidivorans]
MVIYAEYLFTENFITGGIILLLTAKITGFHLKKSLMVLGSALCGIYAFILFWDTLNPWIAILFKIAFSAVLVKLVYPVKGMRQFLRTLLIFYLVSFAMGGITIGAVYFMGLSGITHNSAIYIEGFTYLNIALGCVLTCLLFYFFASFMKGKLIREKTTANVRIEFEEKHVTVKGMVDTGNSLTDPFTGKPVLIISADAASKILPEEMMKETARDEKELAIYERLMQGSFAGRVRLIPYKSIGAEKGFLIGIRPDKIVIEMDHAKGYVNPVNMPEGTILALYKGIFSNENTEEGYSILLHPSVMEGGIACNV